MPWTISTAQMPIVVVGVTVAYHATLLLRDDSGNIRGTINGGPLLPNGQLADASQLGSYLGTRPLGAEATEYQPGHQGGYQFWRPGNQESQLLSGTEANIMSRWSAGIASVDIINSAGLNYYLFPQEDPAARMGNSNSVAASVGAVMVGDQIGRSQLLDSMPNNPGATRSDLLSDSAINQLRANEGLGPILNRWQRTEVDELQPDGTHKVTYTDTYSGHTDAVEILDAQDHLLQSTHYMAQGTLDANFAAGNLAQTILTATDNSRITTLYDPTNTHDYATVTTTTDSLNRTDVVTTLYDDGHRVVRDNDERNVSTVAYTETTTDAQARADIVLQRNDDNTTVTTDYDQASANVWSTIVTNLDNQGRVYQQSGTYDNGTGYINQWDAANSANWSFISSSTDDQGRVYQQSGTYDNGTGYINQWDASNTANWSFISSSTDALGRVYQQSGTYDNGTGYINQWDASNTANWSTIFSNTDAQGHVTVQTGTYDSGAGWVNQYDASNNAAWSTINDSYNAAHQITEEVITNDNGSRTDQFWDRGTADWSTYTTTFNASGVITGEAGSFDNGDTFSETFTAGRLTTVTYVDGGVNDTSWSREVETYNTAGQLTTVDWYSDAGYRDEQDVFDSAGRRPPCVGAGPEQGAWRRMAPL